MATRGGLTPHNDYGRFERAMERYVNEKWLVSWKDPVYRASSPEYGELPNFLSGRGAKLTGARWTPPDGPQTRRERRLLPRQLGERQRAPV